MKQKRHALFRRWPALSTGAGLFTFVAIESLFTFCSSTCPPFSDAKFDRWFPYRFGQALYFTSSLGNKDTIQLDFVHRSGESNRPYYRSCTMDASMNSKLSANNTFDFSVYYSKERDNNFMTFNLYDFRLSDAQLNEQSIVTNDARITSTFAAGTEINGKTFPNVLLLQKDTAGMREDGIYKVWLSQQAGLVGYEHYPSTERWVKSQ